MSSDQIITFALILLAYFLIKAWENPKAPQDKRHTRMKPPSPPPRWRPPWKQRHVIWCYPITAPSLTAALSQSVRFYRQIGHKLQPWGKVKFPIRQAITRSQEPPLPRLRLNFNRTPAWTSLRGRYRPESHEVDLEVANYPPGWVALWAFPTKPEILFPITLIEPEVFHLTYRPDSAEEAGRVLALLEAVFLNYGITPHYIQAMGQRLEALAQTPWGQREAHRPVVAFYQTLSRISHPARDGDDDGFGLGEMWEPLVPYLRPTMVTPFTHLDNTPPAPVDADLLARLYNLRAFSCSLFVFPPLYKTAVEDLDRALSLQPRRAEHYWMNKGTFYARLNEPGEALAAYRRALEIQPNLHYATYARAALYYLLGDTARGREEALQVLQEGPRTLRTLIRQWLSELDPTFPYQPV